MKIIKNYLVLIIVLMSFTINAQKKPIEFETETNKQDNTIQFYCVNNTPITRRVTLTLKNHNGLKGYTNPITKLVKPKSKLLFLDLSFKGAYSYSTSYTSISAMTSQEKNDIAINKEAYILKDFSKINEGIVIFEKLECPRCNRALAFLLDNNIDFKAVNISESSLNNIIMWKILEEKGVTTRKINTPVFLVDGKISHSHKNLNAFLETLKE